MADSYQVLARKWRPQRFEDVVGQSAIVRTLRNALEQGRVAHAYCFSGIRGVGKTTTARLVAKGLNCRAPDVPTAEPCGECESCREIEESRSLDVVEMDAASQTGVDDIRELKEFTRYSPSRDRHRIFIIDEAHMLSRSAFNALLKTLEEPPPHVVFMLATTEPQKIPDTVLSRCQHYHFGRISQREIVARLREIADAESVEISDNALALVAQVADGSLRDAQSLLDKLIAFTGAEIDDRAVVDLLGLVDRELLYRAAELVADGDLEGLLEFVHGMVEQGIDLHQFTLDLLGHFRALMVARTAPEPGKILHLPDEDVRRLREQSEGFGVEDLDRAFNVLAGSEYRIKQAEHPRFHLELVLLRLARLPHLQPLEELIAELRSGGDGSGGSPGGGEEPRQGAASQARSRATPAGSGSGAPSVGAAPRRPSGATEDERPGAPAGAPGGSADVATGPQIEGDDVSRILRTVRERKPMIGQMLDRAHSAELRDDTLWLAFPSNGGLFRERLKDRNALGAIEEAGRAVLGRKIKVVAGSIDENDAPAREQDDDPEAADAGEAKRRRLWQRAEEEPLVQHFVQVLKGQITKVEEYRD